MTSIEHIVPLSGSPFLRLRQAFKNLTLRRKTRQIEVQLEKNLERLALRSPRFLADIGFERDGMASSPQRTVWRRGRHCVVVYTETQLVTVTTR